MAVAAVAIIERFKQDSLYGLSVKSKKETEMAVVQRWSLVEICLYKFLPDIMIINIQEFISKTRVNFSGTLSNGRLLLAALRTKFT